MHLKFTAADKTDVGKQRDQNEDSVYKRVESSGEGDRGLFIVADGMGGYKAGEVASKLAVETISKTLDFFFRPVHDQPTVKLEKADLDPEKTVILNATPADASSPQKTQKLAETRDAAIIEDQLSSAIQQANRAIVRYGEQKSSARGLGSTVTAALVQNNQAYIANVGDSRTYLLRENKLTPVTRDHSLVARLVESKQIEPEDVYTHPQRNLIYRSLGAGHKNVEVDVFHEELQPGDTLLLCSDGLWEMIRHQDLLNALQDQSSPQDICDTLIQLANTNGGEDNISAIVVRVSAH
ncbi:MAG TPA: PP2C family serine/threonine-protein phosphatase [Dictyobacter sp.]|jgi:protein phosphatase|nr:PP2C family serine/threonine-protein phosphatase [Dictyobacter sp.]